MRHIFRSLCALVAVALSADVASATSVGPKTLLIYYSYPSSINATFSVAGAAAEFGQYDYVVLGDLLEKASHPDHANTAAILAQPALSNTTVFGYINLGVSTENLSLTEIETRTDEWQATGATGIFFDLFGYDYDTPRARQNAAVDYAHSKGMPVIANAWIPADAFGTVVQPLNPTGAPTSLNGGDFYLAESFQIFLDSFDSEAHWRGKADALNTFQASLGFKVLSVTTSDNGGVYDQNKFFYAWYSALLDGHEAVGWGEYNYAAVSASAPFRTRPIVDAGIAYAGAVVATSPFFTRRTSGGTVTVDSAAHTVAFLPNDSTNFTPAGRSNTDCLHEWLTQPLPALARNGLPGTRVTCIDDDPSCDIGTPGDHVCNFALRLCFNVADTRLDCAASDTANVSLTSPGISQHNSADAANRGMLETALVDLGAHVQGTCSNSGAHHGATCQTGSDCDTIPGDHSGRCKSSVSFAPPLSAATQCSSTAAIQVPLRNAAGHFKSARKSLSLRAAASDGRRDTDRLTLICQPAP